MKYDLLESNIKKVTLDDLQDFVMARKENIQHYSSFVNEYEAIHLKEATDTKTLAFMKTHLKKAQHFQPKTTQIKTDKITSLIKLGDLTGLKNYFEQHED